MAVTQTNVKQTKTGNQTLSWLTFLQTRDYSDSALRTILFEPATTKIDRPAYYDISGRGRPSARNIRESGFGNIVAIYRAPGLRGKACKRKT